MPLNVLIFAAADERLIVIWGVPALGLLLALACLFGALRAGRRQRLIDNLPTSKTTGVFIGLVELKGTAEAEQPLTSYLAEVPCVHYAWSIDEHWQRTVTRTYTDSDGKTRTRTHTESGWTTVARGGETISFHLQDNCGSIRVNPQGAALEPQSVFCKTCGRGDALYYGKGPAGAVSNSTHRRRFSELAIPLHAAVYVMGTAREREDIVAPEIAHHPDAPVFLISTRTEAQVRAGLRARYWTLGLLGLLPCVGGWLLRDHLGGGDVAEHLAKYVAIGGGYLAAWLLAWTWMAYNCMVDLRQRVRQAWANVDVQLKRRNDLIPSLVRVVEGLRDYERRVQPQLVELRTQMTATAPGQPGPDPEGCVSHLRAVVERYPDLRANDGFMNLYQNLVDTEQRISLARGYFNDIATFYNTRLEIFPDRFLAALTACRPQALLTGFQSPPGGGESQAPSGQRAIGPLRNRTPSNRMSSAQGPGCQGGPGSSG